MRVIVKHCVESLCQAHEVIHEVWPTCTLFVKLSTFVMTDSTQESLHHPVRILLS